MDDVQPITVCEALKRVCGTVDFKTESELKGALSKVSRTKSLPYVKFTDGDYDALGMQRFFHGYHGPKTMVTCLGGGPWSYNSWSVLDRMQERWREYEKQRWLSSPEGRKELILGQWYRERKREAKSAAEAIEAELLSVPKTVQMRIFQGEESLRRCDTGSTKTFLTT